MKFFHLVTPVTGASSPDVLPELQRCQPVHTGSEEVGGLSAQRKLLLLEQAYKKCQGVVACSVDAASAVV